jgi:uncharacterized membrane protein YtjA (UPF0391 family)
MVVPYSAMFWSSEFLNLPLVSLDSYASGAHLVLSRIGPFAGEGGAAAGIAATFLVSLVLMNLFYMRGRKVFFLERPTLEDYDMPEIKRFIEGKKDVKVEDLM